MLASLKAISTFRDSALEVRKTNRLREKRIRIRLGVRVTPLARPDVSWEAHTVDISSRGGVVQLEQPGAAGDSSTSATDSARAIVVVWIGPHSYAGRRQCRARVFESQTNIWDLDLSARTDDEPLMQEIVVAHNVQRRLFPRITPYLRTLDYSGKCVQARTVGGDYYDFLQMGCGRVGLVLADVAGKGIAAALLMASLQGSLHNRAEAGAKHLPDILAAVTITFTSTPKPAAMPLSSSDATTTMLADWRM